MTKILSGAAAAVLLAAVSFTAPVAAAPTHPVANAAQANDARTATDISAARRHVRRYYAPRRHYVRRYYGPRYYRYGGYYGPGYSPYYYRPYYAPRPFFGFGPFAFGF